MSHRATLSRTSLFTALAVVAALSGCASVSLEQSLDRVNTEAADFTGGQVALARTREEQDQRANTSARLLSQPLGQTEAVQLALANSAALQALLAQAWAETASAAQSGRIANPVFGWERLSTGSDLELNRALSFGLLDVLTLPARQGIAQRRIEQAQLHLTGEVVDHVTQVRQAWVRAVASRQTLTYAQQVLESAEASAELARRMQSVGNYNRLTRAREQAFYADAASRLAAAGHEATARREELVRLLGLSESQAQQLQLPDRLPELPSKALSPEVVGQLASKERLDVRLAQSAFASAGRLQGLNTVTSLTDIELTARRNTQWSSAAGTRSDQRGYEIGVRLPIFDWGGLQRQAWNARTLAAANQLESTIRSAGSGLRESYSAYRTAHDIARHFRDEVVPVRKVISEENQLRYNGMIIGVFELLADARDQVNAVIGAINAEQQFWLADAALQASLMGRPTQTALSASSGPTASNSTGH